MPISDRMSKEIPLNVSPLKHVEAISSPQYIKLAELDIVPITTRDYVRIEARKYGWDSGAQWTALETLLTNESGWRWDAVNNSSGACGLFQALPCSKLGKPIDDIPNQASWGLSYIKNRYNTPVAAVSFWYSHSPGWY